MMMISASRRQRPSAMCIELLIRNLVTWTQTICIEYMYRMRGTNNVKSEHEKRVAECAISQPWHHPEPQRAVAREKNISTGRQAWCAAHLEIARLHLHCRLMRPRIYGNACVALSCWKPCHHKQIRSVHHTLSGNMFSRNEQSQYEIMSFNYNDQNPLQYIKEHGHAQSPHGASTVVIKI